MFRKKVGQSGSEMGGVLESKIQPPLSPPSPKGGGSRGGYVKVMPRQGPSLKMEFGGR